ncbi:hypothetical protein [Haloplanus rubicundus]|nr:hypothetical protein [Haloplanus rubicundus]
MSEGWVASDSTPNHFGEKQGETSLVSVSVAVDDVDSFQEDYFQAIREVVGQENLIHSFPILKGSQFNRAMPDSHRRSKREELVESLLSISSVETIQVTETYIEPRWIELFTQDDSTDTSRLSADQFKRNKLSQYYNLVSIWKYLTYGDSRATDTQWNVMTDNFSGKRTPLWEEIGELADQLRVIPYGDRTYPLLAMSDLLLTYLKQEVYPLFYGKIYDKLNEIAGEACYINSHRIPDPEYEDEDEDEIIEMLTPHRNDDVNLAPHYPSPTIYINRQGFDKETLLSLDLFSYACKYAQENEGCVKLFEEQSDREYFQDGDLLINMKSGSDVLNEYEKLNREKAVKVLSSEEAMEFLNGEME